MHPLRDVKAAEFGAGRAGFLDFPRIEPPMFIAFCSTLGFDYWHYLRIFSNSYADPFWSSFNFFVRCDLMRLDVSSSHNTINSKYHF